MEKEITHEKALKVVQEIKFTKKARCLLKDYIQQQIEKEKEFEESIEHLMNYQRNG